MINHGGSVMKTKVVILLLFIVCLGYNRGTAQTISGKYSTVLDQVKADSILSLLGSEKNIIKVPEAYFGEVHDRYLADMIYFIDERGKSKSSGNAALIVKNRKRHCLFGEKYVYVMVFIATGTGPDSRCRPGLSIDLINNRLKISMKKPGEQALGIEVRHSALAKEPVTGAFALLSLFEKIGSSIKLPSSAAPIDATVEGKTWKVEAEPVYTSEDLCLYLAYKKVPLCENTINRVRVNGFRENDRYLATFGNHSGARVTSSVGVLASFRKDNAGCADGWEPEVSFPDFRPAIFGHFYIFRPQMPRPRKFKWIKRFWQGSSVSIVLGTNLSGNFMDDCVAGICWGHMADRIGVIAGYNHKKTVCIHDQEDKERIERKPALSLGISYIF